MLQFISTISKEEKEKEILKVIHILESNFLTGKNISSFYKPNKSNLPILDLKSMIDSNGVKLRDITLGDIKEFLNGKALRFQIKFPTKDSYTYGLIRVSINFEGNKMILGESYFKFYPGDPNLWPFIQGVS